MATSINIDSTVKYDICSQKCAYNFKYPETYLQIKNNSNCLSMSFLDPNDQKSAQVTYNNIDYTVSEIILTYPSLHTFNQSKADGELIIQHISTTGNNLWVCIPIKQSDSSSGDLSDILNDPSLDTYKNEANRKTVLNYNHNFSLQHLIPVKPFYNYIGTYGALSGDFIVFDMLNAISLNINILHNLTTPNNLILTGETIYYNEKGPNLTDLSDGIYISCKPTGESQELVDITKPKNNVTFGEYNNSLMVFIKIVIGILLLIFVFIIISSFLKLVAPKLSNTISGAANDALTK